MVTLLESDSEYHTFSDDLLQHIRMARKVVKKIKRIPHRRRQGLRVKKKSLRAARRSLAHAIKVRDTFVSLSGKFVCDLTGIPVEEFNIRKSIAVQRGEAYRVFLQDRDLNFYDQTVRDLEAELSQSLSELEPTGDLIYALPLYLGSQSGASSGQWLSLYGKLGTPSISSLGEVRVQGVGENIKRIIVSSAIMGRPDIFFLAVNKFVGDLTRLRVISKGAVRMSKVANGYAVSELSLGGSYQDPCFCSDCPGDAKNSNCSSGCCVRPD